ncbi:MAG TPA: ABC transporter permease [Beutenbergiaceae bacterium]|nr:ABC transporter permease [Beutenbergiaceae bacterium]
MSATSTTIDTGGSTITGSLRRTLALGKLEAKLLGRNKTALFNAVGMAPVLVLILLPVVGSMNEGADLFGAQLLAMLACFGILFIAYYNLTTTAVARREELMLKRLTSGEVSHGEVLIGMATPSAIIVLAQLVLGTVAVGFAFELPALTNPVLVIVALAAGFAVFALLAYASSGLTKTVESAQLTTLPVIFVAMLASGVAFPLEVLPDGVQRVAELTPLAPVMTLLQLGLSGVDADGQVLTFAETFSAGLLPLVVLGLWCVIGALASRRWMRWEPRR